jgi:hypothetical protein
MYLNGENLDTFILIISKNFLRISSSNSGTRVIQKYIEIISIKNNHFNNNEKNPNLIYLKCFTILNSLIIKNIKEISKDNNSCHIIIKFVSEIPFPENDNLYKSNIPFPFLLSNTIKIKDKVINELIRHSKKIQSQSPIKNNNYNNL